MNYPEAHANIVAILNSMNPRPSLVTWAAMMLWKTRVHPETGKYSETCAGPNARFTQEEADAICHQVQMRASLPSAAYESKLHLEDRLDLARMMLSHAKDFIDSRGEWDEENANWLSQGITAMMEESEKRSAAYSESCHTPEIFHPFADWSEGKGHFFGLCVQNRRIVTVLPESGDWTEYHINYMGGGIYEIERCPYEATGTEEPIYRGKIPNREFFMALMNNMETPLPDEWETCAILKEENS